MINCNLITVRIRSLRVLGLNGKQLLTVLLSVTLLYLFQQRALVPNAIAERYWLCDAQTCIKWNSLWSYVFQINFGVKQVRSVLSPVLFAIYVDDVARCCKKERYLHADDILLLAPSVTRA